MVMKRFRNSNYSIDEYGNVFNQRGRQIRPWVHTGRGTSYYRVQLTIDGVPKHYRVHRMVAECYLPNPQNKPQVHHKDRNTFNNHVSNLEWSTNQENNRQKKRHT